MWIMGVQCYRKGERMMAECCWILPMCQGARRAIYRHATSSSGIGLIIPMLKIRKLRLRCVMQITESHKAGQWKSWVKPQAPPRIC